MKLEPTPPGRMHHRRTRASVIGLIAVIVLAACLWDVRIHSSARARADAGEDSRPKGGDLGSSAPGPDGPALTKKARPSADAIAANRAKRKWNENQEREAAKQLARAEGEAERVARLKSYLTPGFALTPKSAEEFHLPESEVAAARQVLGRTWAELSARAAANLVHDEKASAMEAKGTRIYRLAGEKSESEREEIYSRLGRLLDEAINTKPVWNNGFPLDPFEEIREAVYQDPSFALMGTKDCVIRFIPGENTAVEASSPGGFTPDETYTVEITFYDVEVGQQVYQARGGIELLESLFGNFFQTPR